MVVGSRSTGPVYSGLLIGGRLIGVGFAGGFGKSQPGKLRLVVTPGPDVEFQFSGGPFVINGHGGSVSVLVWVRPLDPVTVVIYGGSSRL